MFAVKIRQIYIVCDKLVVRNLRNRGGSKLPEVSSTSGGNPGLNKRIQAFRKDGIKIQDDDTEEFIEQSESSFYQVHDAYNEHLNETFMGKHELRHHVVKQKYFKENMPNLLTWSEKEQIRHLANTYPDEWTPQRIAESFPVTEQVAKKLLKYPWKPASEQRISRHDASAMRNWKELKEGSLNINEDLRNHFLKFSERKIPPLDKKSIKMDLSPEAIGEFESIVRKCAEKENSSKDEYESYITSETDESIRKSIKKDFKRVTLDQLTTKIKNRLDKGKNVDITDKLIMDSITAADSSPKQPPEMELLHDTTKEKQLTVFKEDESQVSSVLNYPERIRIPKKAYKKGATYKIEDRFYDDDGRFLYRVLGMTENKY